MIYTRISSNCRAHIRFCVEWAGLLGFELYDATPELPHFCLYNKHVDEFRPLAILSVSLDELHELQIDPGRMLKATRELVKQATAEKYDRGFPYDPVHHLFD